MTDQIQIGDVAPRIRYTADGATALFSYPFVIFATPDLEVYLDDVLLSEGSDYVVSGAGVRAGGIVAFTSPPAAGAAVTLVRRLSIQRTADFAASGDFKASVINAELDFQAAAMQQVNDDLVRSLRTTKTDAAVSLVLPDAETRALKTLIFGDIGHVTAQAVIDASGELAVSEASPMADSESGDAGSALDVSAADHAHPFLSWADVGIATQGEAEAGSGNTTLMTPLCAGQAIAALGTKSDNTARNMAASALAYVMASYDAAVIAGNVGVFYLSDTFESDSLNVSTNASYDTGGDYYHNDDPSPPDMTLAPSAATLATADPLDVIGYFVFEPVDAVSFGTDLIGEASIDGGTTYAAGTWTKVADIGSAGRELHRLDANVSAQTGTSLLYRLSSTNGKEIRFHECTGLVAVY